MTNPKDEIKMVRVSASAHGALTELTRRLAKEKGLRAVTYTDAVSLAILEALQKRREAEKATRQPAL